MAEDKESKTERPTPKRLDEARRKGQVGRSQDLSMAVLLLATAAMISLYGSRLARGMMGQMRDCLGERMRECVRPGAVLHMDLDRTARILHETILFVLDLILPLAVAFFLVAFVVGILQVGWKPSIQALEFKPEKFNPVTGMKRLVNLRSIMRSFFSTVKFTILALVLYYTLSGRILQILNLNRVGAVTAADFMMDLITDLLWVIALVLVVLGILDLVYQKWQHFQDMKMTKQEVKDERKSVEGNPEIKSQIKQAQRRMARMRMMQDVPEADVVITNPTHAAVALQYDPEVMAAPQVRAKGWNETALRIREIARENGVPLYEDPPLARGLCTAAEVGDEVPVEYYEAVAAVLSHVYRLSGGAPAGVGGTV